MFSTFLQVAITGAVFLLLLALYRVEDARGKRLFLSGLRGKLDRSTRFMFLYVTLGVSHLLGYVAKFLLHHGVQSLLKKALTFVRSVEAKLEDTLRRQRRGSKLLVSEHVHNHLDDIAEHKVTSALSEKEKQRLRSH